MTQSIQTRKLGKSVYLFSLAALGLGLIAACCYQLYSEGIGYQWLLLTALAGISANASLKIPGVNSKISVADTFVLTSMIFFGPAAGCITAAAEGLCGSLRSKTKSKRLQFTLFNMGSLAICAYLAAHLFFLVSGTGPFCQSPGSFPPNLFLAVVILALGYYLLNSGSVALMVALDSGGNAYRIWKENFVWQVMNYFACAFAAILISLNSSLFSPSVLISLGLVVMIIDMAYRNLLRRLATNPQA